jgi:hypothetical protein
MTEIKWIKCIATIENERFIGSCLIINFLFGKLIWKTEEILSMHNRQYSLYWNMREYLNMMIRTIQTSVKNHFSSSNLSINDIKQYIPREKIKSVFRLVFFDRHTNVIELPLIEYGDLKLIFCFAFLLESRIIHMNEITVIVQVE